MNADRKALLQKLQRSAEGAAHWAAALRALETPDFDAAYPLVRGYVLEKLLLEPEEADGCDALLDLADRSLRKILRLKREGKLTGDISRGCSGASSVITKKVLLMKAAQGDFRLALSPAQAAQVTTAAALTRCILEQRGAETP